MSDPTRIDAGMKDELRIEIVFNPSTRAIQINGNVADPILFNYLMGEAIQTHSRRQMKIRAEMNSRRITVPQ